MGKMKLMCAALMLLGSVPLASAGRGHGHHGHHNHGHHHHRHGGGHGGYGLALGMGLLGYGLGYYGNRAPYYPPSYGYGNQYGYPPVGYAPNYGYAQPYGYAPAVVAPPAHPFTFSSRRSCRSSHKLKLPTIGTTAGTRKGIIPT